MSRFRGCVGLVFAVALAGCDAGTERYVAAHRPDGGYAWRGDGGVPDAALPGEGGMLPFEDVFGLDGGVRYVDGSIFLQDGGAFPWMLPDGAVVLPDGAVVLADGAVLALDDAIRRYADAFQDMDVAECVVSEDNVFVRPDVAFSEVGAFDLTAGATGFGIAHRDETCGKADALFAGAVGATGMIAAPDVVLDACKQIESVELLWSEDRWRMVWTDNATNTLELRTQEFDEAFMPMDKPVVLTDNDRHEEAPTLVDVAGRPMLVWIENDGGGRSVLTLMLDDADAEPVTVVPETAGHAPSTLAAAQVGTEAAAVAWVEETSQRGIWLQRLDADGAPVGTPIQLTKFAGGGSTIALATRETGGAAVYSVVIDASAGDPTVMQGREVRFRRLDMTGAPRGGEIKLVSAPEQGSGASVVRVGGGYAVAYRSRTGGAAAAEIRLMFISKEGTVYRDPQGRVISYSVAPASFDGSGTKIDLSNDGYLLIGHADGQDSGGNQWTLIRRRLDCQ